MRCHYRNNKRCTSLGPRDESDEEGAPTFSNREADAMSISHLRHRRERPMPYAAPARPQKTQQNTQQQVVAQFVSDGSRVYQVPVIAPSAQPPPPKKISRGGKFLQNYIFPSNAGRSLLPRPSLSRTSVNTAGASTEIKYPSPMRRYSRAQSIEASTKSASSKPSLLPTPPIIPSSPSIVFGFSPQPSFSQPNPIEQRHGFDYSVAPSFQNTRDQEVELIPSKGIKPYHRSGGGNDIRKLRQHFMVRNAAAVVASGQSSEVENKQEAQVENADILKKNDQEQNLIEPIVDESPTLADVAPKQNEDSLKPSVDESLIVAITSKHDDTPKPNLEEPPVIAAIKEHEIIEIEDDEEPNLSVKKQDASLQVSKPPIVQPKRMIHYSFAPSFQRKSIEGSPESDISAAHNKNVKLQSLSNEKVDDKKEMVKEDGELSEGEFNRSSSPECIILDSDSDDEIQCISIDNDPTDPDTDKLLFGSLSSKAHHREAEMMDCDPPPQAEDEFNLQKFCSNYEDLLKTLREMNEKREKFCENMIKNVFDLPSLYDYEFLLTGATLEQSYCCEDDQSEIEFFVAPIIEDNEHWNSPTAIENVSKILTADSGITQMSFNKIENLIIIFEHDDTVTIRPMDKLSFLRSAFIGACSRALSAFHDVLLLLKHCVRRFKTAIEVPDFIINFAVVKYFQEIKCLLADFDYDLKCMDIKEKFEISPIGQPSKTTDTLFYEILFFVQNCKIKCPFTQEVTSLDQTLLPEVAKILLKMPL